MKIIFSRGRRRGQFGFGFDLGWDKCGIDLFVTVGVWHWAMEVCL